MRSDDPQDDALPAYLSTELSKRAGRQGANVGHWPGLTIYRFAQPAHPRWDEIESLSIGLLVQGTAAATVMGGRRLQGRMHFVVIGNGQHFDCRILQPSPDQPTLCVVVEVPPQLVHSVSTSMHGRAVPGGQQAGFNSGCAVSTPGADLVRATVRFMESLSSGSDRRVLAPLHLQELIYRALQSEQRGRLLRLAAQEARESPIASALTFISAHLGEPLTVDILAAQVCLSPSAFSRVFRTVTGRSPYRYVKEARLDRARRLLDDGQLGVADVARSVGYTSVSHFIKEFRTRIGLTPGEYAAAQVRWPTEEFCLGGGSASLRDVAS